MHETRGRRFHSAIKVNVIAEQGIDGSCAAVNASKPRSRSFDSCYSNAQSPHTIPDRRDPQSRVLCWTTRNAVFPHLNVRKLVTAPKTLAVSKRVAGDPRSFRRWVAILPRRSHAGSKYATRLLPHRSALRSIIAHTCVRTRDDGYQSSSSQCTMNSPRAFSHARLRFAPIVSFDRNARSECDRLLALDSAISSAVIDDD